MSDDAGTGQWMTYDELAAARGIKRIGAVRLVQRYKWRRQAGNDGRARVLVPHDAIEKVRGSDASLDDAGTVGGTDAGNAAGSVLARALAALENALSAAERDKLALRAALDQALTTVADATARADRAEAALVSERAKVADLALLKPALDQALAAVADLSARADAAVSLADQATRLSAEAIARADRAEAVIETARIGRAVAETDAAELRQAEAELRWAEDERKARGRWARLRAAWRGE